MTCSSPAVAEDFCQWEDTPGYFAKEKVRLDLDRNVTIEGKWIGIDAQMEKFVVSKTSDRKLYSKGLVMIPRDSIRAVAYRGHGTFGKVLGLLGGFMMAGPVVFLLPVVVAIPGYVGAIVGSVYAGNAVDRRWHAVTILP